MKGWSFMEIKLFGDKRTVLVRIMQELDHHAAAEIRKKTDAKIKSSNAINVVFDFSSVEFMDSSGIGLIMGRYKMAKILGGKVVIYGAGKQIQRIIEMSGIDRLVKIYKTLDEAIKAL